MSLAAPDLVDHRAAVPRREPMACAGRVPEILVDARCSEDWDRLVANFLDVNYDQTAAYSRLLWGGRRLSEMVLRERDEVLAAARGAIFTLPGLRRGLAYVRGGPLWRRRGETADPGTYRTALEAIKAEYCGSRGHHLIVMPRFDPDFLALEAQMLQEAGFRVLRQSADPNRYFVNLQIDRERQMRSLDQGWRRNLKKALATPFEIGLCDTPADIDCFVAMNKAMRARKQFVDNDVVFSLRQLSDELPPALRPRIVLARHNGRPVVGAAIVIAGDIAQYLFGASDDSMLPLKAGYALQWWIIDWLSREDVRWYDLGGEAFSDGLRQFKRGLVGKEGQVMQANVEWEFAGSRSGRAAAELIFAVRRARRCYTRRVAHLKRG